MKENGYTICYTIMPEENFETAVKNIFAILQEGQERYPNQSRTLLIEVEGHQIKPGIYDKDMQDLLCRFSLPHFLPYVTTLLLPFAGRDNEGEQINEIPDPAEIIQTWSRR